MKQILSFFTLCLFLLSCQAKQEGQELKVMQFNIWQEGTVVEGGFQAIVDNIVALQPDLVTFSEVRNYDKVSFIPKLLQALRQQGAVYYGEESVSTGIIAKQPVEKQEVVYPLQNDRGSVIKATLRFAGHDIALYSAHLDWLNCSSYLPRGYHSCTWKKIAAPVLDPDSVLRDNRASFRDDEVQAILKDAEQERAKGTLVFIGGDFNEPSHLDWQANTAHIRDHQGLVLDWDCSVMLANAGFVDTYREVYPDPVRYPGFTFPANNEQIGLDKLVWAADADERERIDFIYYLPNPALTLQEVVIVGPQGNILNGERTDKDPDGEDPFCEPHKGWPTDHKALLATFRVR